jgi:hypothetical protein
MPNWCENSVVLKHEDPTFVARARESFNRGELLNEFVPVPKDLLEAMAGSFGDADKQKDLEIQTAYNIKNYGYSNWYDFCIAEWGTKWDIGANGQPAQDIEGGLMLNFESAWAPPIEAYSKLKSMGFYIEAFYYEGGMGFCGAWMDGEDEYYQIEGNSEWVEANIPEYIDEAFGISQNMAEWEEENAEE